MKNFPRGNLPFSVLSAIIIGFLLCPFLYIFVILGFHSYEDDLAFHAAVPLVPADGFLLWSLILRKPDKRSNILLHIGEGVSATIVAALFFVLSGYTLFTRFERLGSACTFFFVAFCACLPFALMRMTALAQRLRRLPRAGATGLSVAIMAPSFIFMMFHLLSRPAALLSH